MVLGALLGAVSTPADAARRFDGVWTVRQNNELCRWTPPPYQIRIENGRVVGLSGNVSPSGEIRWSLVNKEGNLAVLTGRLRGNSGTGHVVVVSTHCQGTFSMRRQR
jgi:hypothetical protein